MLFNQAEEMPVEYFPTLDAFYDSLKPRSARSDTIGRVLAAWVVHLLSLHNGYVSTLLHFLRLGRATYHQ